MFLKSDFQNGGHHSASRGNPGVQLSGIWAVQLSRFRGHGDWWLDPKNYVWPGFAHLTQKMVGHDDDDGCGMAENAKANRQLHKEMRENVAKTYGCLLVHFPLTYKTGKDQKLRRIILLHIGLVTSTVSLQTSKCFHFHDFSKCPWPQPSCRGYGLSFASGASL